MTTIEDNIPLPGPPPILVSDLKVGQTLLVENADRAMRQRVYRAVRKCRINYPDRQFTTRMLDDAVLHVWRIH